VSWRNGLEPWHLLILFGIVLVVFGATKLPGFAQGIGRSIGVFKAEVHAPEGDDAPAELSASGAADRAPERATVD
jgi:sec-independent protein translocase protein TatA